MQGPHMAMVPVRPPLWNPILHLSSVVYDRDILHPEPHIQGFSLCFKAPISYRNELCAVKGEACQH